MPGFAYDEVPYRYRPIPQTHPDHLATLASVMGMSPAPAESCRVLELGCGDGSNLLPMALTLPRSSFVGCDLSKTAVDQAQASATALQLQNAIFLHADVAAVAADLGEFDYIIAHGLYSWVPTDVREAILAICEHHLTAQGVAFISYNAYPGSHARNMLRDILLYHTHGVTNPQEKMRMAAGLLELLAASKPKSAALRDETERLRSLSPSTLFHDDLAEMNQPLLFHEFMSQAGKHRLQYLAEAEFVATQAGRFPEPVRHALESLSGGDVIKIEQYMDFLDCRRFRQTLLCRQEITITRGLSDVRLSRFGVAARLQPAPPAAGDDAAQAAFQGAGDFRITTNRPLYKAALSVLAELWPMPVPFADLLNLARGRLDDGGHEDDPELLGYLVMQLFRAGGAELSLSRPRFVLEAPSRPVAFPLARHQALTQSWVTNLRHEPVQLDHDRTRRLLALLDGTRGEEAIGPLLEAPNDVLQEELTRLARAALLIA